MKRFVDKFLEKLLFVFQLISFQQQPGSKVNKSNRLWFEKVLIPKCIKNISCKLMDNNNMLTIGVLHH